MPEMTVHFAAIVFADVISADHNILTGESESRWQSRHAVVVQGLFTKRIPKLSFPKRSHKQGTMMRLQRFHPPDRKPKNNPHRQQSRFFRACDEMCWTHDTSTPRRPEKITEGSSSRMGPCCERNKALKSLALHCLDVMIMVIFMAHQAQDGDCCHQLQMSTAT